MSLYADGLFDKFLPIINGCRGKVRWAALNALEHLEMADKISGLDPNMAAFRAICAEEEAASSLIYSIQGAKYAGSESVRAKAHPHKQAIIFFIKAIAAHGAEFLEKASNTFDKMAIHPSATQEGRPALAMSLKLKGSEMAMTPIPPLFVYSEKKGGGSGWEESIRNELHSLTGTSSMRKLKRRIEARANLRNQLLYASPGQTPKLTFNLDIFVQNQAGIVHAILTALALIDPWHSDDKGPVPLITEALQVFKKIMHEIEETK